MKIVLIRHGKTEGNLYRRYIGVTDEKLCEEGRNELKDRGNMPDSGFRKPEYLFVSPLLRCRETAELLFPGQKQIVVPELAEMNFGIFENRSFQEDLKDSPEYRKWIDSGCEDPIPEGESKRDFTDRCCRGFERAMGIIVQNPAQDPEAMAVFVVHGGTIMSILSRYGCPAREYYEWRAENGGGFAGNWDGTAISCISPVR